MIESVGQHSLNSAALTRFVVLISKAVLLPRIQRLAQSKPSTHPVAFSHEISANSSSEFLPGAGPLMHLSTPDASDEVRIDTGVRQGLCSATITMYVKSLHSVCVQLSR